jgi:hypothetical protein
MARSVRDRPMNELTADSFAPHTGTTFTLCDAGVELVLTEVLMAGDSPSGRPFTLTFTSPAVFGQGTYDVQHPDLGRLAIFLVPRQPLADGSARYHAVFN